MFLTSAFYFFFFLSFIFLLVNLPDNSSSVESLNMKEWQDGLRALLPNININFGGLPNSSSPSNANHSAPTSNPATTDNLSWDSPGSWTDPAIITGNFLTPSAPLTAIRSVFSTDEIKKEQVSSILASSHQATNVVWLVSWSGVVQSWLTLSASLYKALGT